MHMGDLFTTRFFPKGTSAGKAHTHTHTHTHIYIYIYIYIERERERERGGDPKTYILFTHQYLWNKFK